MPTKTLAGFRIQPREANISYLMMARTMVEVDRNGAIECLGLSPESAEALLKLTPAEILRMSKPRTPRS